MAQPAPTTLLVVDDSEFEHQVIARLLKPVSGLRLIFAGGGAQALEAVRREVPHLILTDLVMPDMDGLELVKQVRTDFPSIPLILMTAFGSEEAAMRALRAGAANYIPKKDLARDLTETIQRVLHLSATNRHRRQLLHYLTCRESTFLLDNDPDLITPLIDLIQEEIDGLGLFDRMGQIRVGVALQEALTNALFHGNLEVSSELREADEALFYQRAEAHRRLEPYASRKIRVVVHLDGRAASFVIDDEGPGFDTSRLNQPVEPGDLASISGRGLLLIRALMDEVAFNPTGNSITMIKRPQDAPDPEQGAALPTIP
jgi:CheY-like chemotaxis protein/anti-sigma regulatory factor (Ser/Thr protein kinase)